MALKSLKQLNSIWTPISSPTGTCSWARTSVARPCMSKTASFISRLRRARFLSLFIKRRERERQPLASPLRMQELRVVFGWTAWKARKIKSCALCCQAAGTRATIIEYYEQKEELAATNGWGTRVVWGMPELTLLSRHCEELRRNLRFQQQLQLQTESETFRRWSSPARKRVKALS